MKRITLFKYILAVLTIIISGLLIKSSCYAIDFNPPENGWYEYNFTGEWDFISGKSYYKNGVAVSGMQYIDGDYYYFYEYDPYYTNWRPARTNYRYRVWGTNDNYYFDNEGKRVKNYWLDEECGLTYEGEVFSWVETHYYGEDGKEYLPGIHEIDGKKCLFLSNGLSWLNGDTSKKFVEGISLESGIFYLQNKDTVGKEREYYYFDGKNGMVTNQWVEFSPFEDSALWMNSFPTLESVLNQTWWMQNLVVENPQINVNKHRPWKFYFDENGICRDGIVEIDGKSYCFYFGLCTEHEFMYGFDDDGDEYYGDKNGEVVKDKFVRLKNKHYDEKNGYSEELSDSIRYYGKDGKRVDGWFNVDGKKYYSTRKDIMVHEPGTYLDTYDSDKKFFGVCHGGVAYMLYEDQKTDERYYFNDEGAMCTGWIEVPEYMTGFDSEGNGGTKKVWMHFNTTTGAWDDTSYTKPEDASDTPIEYDPSKDVEDDKKEPEKEEKPVEIAEENDIVLATKQKADYKKYAKGSDPNEIYKIKYENPSDKKIAVFSSKGILTAKKEGNIVITVQKGNKAYKFKVKVVNPQFVYNDPKTKCFNMNVGETLTPKYLSCDLNTVFSLPANCTCATINSKTGEIKAKSKGTVKITATVGTGKLARKVTAKVKIYDPQIKIGKDNPIAVGKKIKAKIINGNKITTWKSLNTSVATIDSKGVITAVKEGTATIVATNNGKTITKKITVIAGL